MRRQGTKLSGGSRAASPLDEAHSHPVVECEVHEALHLAIVLAAHHHRIQLHLEASVECGVKTGEYSAQVAAAAQSGKTRRIQGI
jgi:hypothetical protein